jgi:antitoxin HicB
MLAFGFSEVPAMPRSFDYTVVLEPQPEGGFTVHVPALPEVVTEGDTEAEALAMAEEAIRLVLEYRLEKGMEIVPDIPPTLHTRG